MMQGVGSRQSRRRQAAARRRPALTALDSRAQGNTPAVSIIDPLRGRRSPRPGRQVAQRDAPLWTHGPSGKRRNAALLYKWAAPICPTRRAACFCPLAAFV